MTLANAGSGAETPHHFPHPDLPRNLLAFAARLRAAGFTAGPLETQDALRALTIISLGDMARVRDALSLIFCTRHDQEALFDLLFRAFFLPAPTKRVPPEAQAKGNGEDGDHKEAPQRRRSGLEGEGRGGGAPLEFNLNEDEDAGEGGAPSLRALFSPFSLPTSAPAEVPQEGMDEMLGAASALVARLRLGRSRRWRAGLKGRRLHVRRTLRGSLQTGGEPLKPAWLEHPHRKPRIVLLLDGSRSMSLYSGRLLQFAHALTRRAARVEVFLFSTELKRVTPSLKRTTHAPTLRDLGAAWGGGTRIGACLATFAKRHGGTLTRDTLVIVASDGLDTGRPEALGRALREVQRASAGVLWLNPLLNTKDYAPTAGGMQAALPFIDTFTTAESAADFGALARGLRLRR